MMQTVSSSPHLGHTAAVAHTLETAGPVAETAAALLSGTALVTDGFAAWLGQEQPEAIEPWANISSMPVATEIEAPIIVSDAVAKEDIVPDAWIAASWTLISQTPAQETAAAALHTSDDALQAMEDFLLQLENEPWNAEEASKPSEAVAQKDTQESSEANLTTTIVDAAGVSHFEATWAERAAVLPPSLGVPSIAFDPSLAYTVMESVESESSPIEYASDLQESLSEDASHGALGDASGETFSQGQSQDHGPKENFVPTEISEQDPMASSTVTETYVWKEALEHTRQDSFSTRPIGAAAERVSGLEKINTGTFGLSWSSSTMETQVPGQIASAIQRMEQQGKERWMIQLEPYDLGRVDIAVEFRSEQRATVTMWVEKPTTLETLRATENQLRQQLEGLGSQMQFDFHSQQQASGQGTSLAELLHRLDDASSLNQSGWVAEERLLGIYV
jgi:flagellar hook-length control protein FliK